MKFREIFRFELSSQLSRPWPWAVFVVLSFLSFLMTRDGGLATALVQDFFINSPFAILKTTVLGGFAWLMMAAPIAGEAGARDISTRIHPLVWTSPLRKLDYLAGHFLAAFAINVALLMSVQAGILLGIHLPGVDPAMMGPIRPEAFLTAFAYLSLPLAFVATALQYTAALRSGRTTAAFLASLFLFFMGFLISGILSFRVEWGALLDPIGMRFVLSDLSHMWTTTEKNIRLLELRGNLLLNRLLWCGMGALTIVVTYMRFRFRHRTEIGLIWRRSREKRRVSELPSPTELTVPAKTSTGDIDRRPSGLDRVRQVVSIASSSLRTLASSWAGRALLIVIPLFTAIILLDQLHMNGMPILPTTGQVLKHLTAPISAQLSQWVILPMFIIYFAGELIWREREAGVDEITDALPGSEWIAFLGKLGGLALFLVLFLSIVMGVGIAMQLILGFSQIDTPLYLAILFGMQLPEYLLFAVLAMVIHIVVNHKYLGHLLAIFAYVFIVLSPLFGVHHNLLVYGGGPWWMYTDMRGLRPFIAPWMWFRLYWAGWAIVLAVLARLMWPRGKETTLRARLGESRRRLAGKTTATAIIGALLVLTLGAFVFYNTNILNEYRSPDEARERRAEYERLYGKYARLPQPQPDHARLEIEIYPERRAVDVHGAYELVNHTTQAIESIHLAINRSIEMKALRFDRSAEKVLDDEAHAYQIYKLARPLEPGDSISLEFDLHAEVRGFLESDADVSIVPNGTYFKNGSLPAVGYQRSRELMTPGERREYGLPERPVVPSLYDEEASAGQHRGVTLHTVIGTTADQTAIAPGALVRTWGNGGRRYFEYDTEEPIGIEWSFGSARYEVVEHLWKAQPETGARDVRIRILHHPTHTGHVNRALESIVASLDYYTRELAPYPYGYLSVVEIPGDGIGVHADSTMLTHGEGVTLLKPKKARGEFDLLYAIFAHEMGHQWNIPAAFVEGAPIMSESVATFEAMKVVEHTKGRAQLRQYQRFMRLPYPYPPIRRGEPLLRGLDPYMAYRKGPFALFTLSETIGEDRVLGALSKLYRTYRPEGAGLATTLDLYRELETVTPADHRQLLHDLFEVNTVWDIELERATARRSGESWNVTMEIVARKIVIDEAGNETEIPLDESMDVVVFGPPQQGESELSTTLYLHKHRIESGRQTITVAVAARPLLAGVDPFHLFDWEEEEDDNNIEEVRIED